MSNPSARLSRRGRKYRRYCSSKKRGQADQRRIRLLRPFHADIAGAPSLIEMLEGRAARDVVGDALRWLIAESREDRVRLAVARNPLQQSDYPVIEPFLGLSRFRRLGQCDLFRVPDEAPSHCRASRGEATGELTRTADASRSTSCPERLPAQVSHQLERPRHTSSRRRREIIQRVGDPPSRLPPERGT